MTTPQIRANNEALFWQLAEELQKEEPRVCEGTIVNGRCLSIGDEFLALVDVRDSSMVVKLSRERVSELVAAGIGKPFGPAGKAFEEWVSIPEFDRARWWELLREGVAQATRESDSTPAPWGRVPSSDRRP
jgi:hypothetical protein